ncbi:ComEC/Rec2 family competence protein [Sphingomonas sp.]|jgi:competence protein ComEC|uniref:ComEC/Rec2 family competence protein n=1 Tax=Sphingomonas sp. TaxID=28214 RepID=UPI002E2F6A8D|nr:ComEC/Rec2 family competence protein [Sphingomonas sp.]HEX4694019.1 ComEC/Rec2 family competence protein [Sphingomonas sp.]
MATIAEGASSTHVPWLQTQAARGLRARHALENWLEAERDQLPLWLPVALGAGIAAWFVLPDPAEWRAMIVALTAVALAAVAVGRHGRAGRAIAIGAAVMALGIALAWWRAERVAAPVLARPAIVTMTARVESVEPLPAREVVRLRLAPIAAERAVQNTSTPPSFAPPRRRPGPSWGNGCNDAQRSPIGRSQPGPGFRRGSVGCESVGDEPQAVTLPPHIRINLAQADMPADLSSGAVIKLQARLMPPNEATVPGAYDFRRVAWFDGLGATGKGIAPVALVTRGAPSNGLRAALAAHIEAELPGSAGGIAAALAAGDEGAITQEDSTAMRRSGLAHLLSVSGLHITAAVAFTIWIVTRLLALWPWLALRARIPVIAAGAGALAAIGYTMLTGDQVPTMRSCIAALLVLAALAMGREAITLRLVAAGAFLVMLVWPEALMGPSFQLSFAAVGSIVALHEQPTVKGWFMKRDESRWRKVRREIASLLLTGTVVEIALSPIALYHFHKEGLYGALANIFAIPLTTFVIMPAEALALVFDSIGLGAPFWWLAGKALALLLWIAHLAAGAPGSLAMLPAMPLGAYGLMIVGGLWITLWRTRARMAGVLPFLAGAAWALATPAPDLLISGDGEHLAVRTPDGGIAMLRDRSGDYARQTMAENAGVDGDAMLLSEQPFASCSPDACLAVIASGGRSFRILATRSLYQLPMDQLSTACRTADIVVSDRRLPRSCTPHWLKLDSTALRNTGGIAIALSSGRIVTVRQPGDTHPWAVAGALSRSAATVPRAGLARAPGRANNAAGRMPGWPGRAGP